MKNYNSILSSYESFNSFSSDKSNDLPRKGLTILSATLFIAGEMAGSGILALPKAVVNAGWIGMILLPVLCFNAAYGGVKLAACWEIVEERFPEHRGDTRNPYATIASVAVGKWGSFVVSHSIRFTLFGAGTVYLLLASSMLQELLKNVLFDYTSCSYFLIIAIALMLPMWLGSPKHFSFAGFGAILTTAGACLFYFVQIISDSETIVETNNVTHKVHGFEDFFLAFGTLLFAFGGASTFPTIQNDMRDRKKFKICVVIAFIIISILYFPIAFGGYFVYGEKMLDNFALVLTESVCVTIGNVLMAIHLIFAFLIVVNPVCQDIEESFKIPKQFNWKRCLIRFSMTLLMIVVGESIPSFRKILALVGGSTVTLMTFVFPPYFYIKLCQQRSNGNWSDRHISLTEKVYLWELIFLGLIGGTASTYSAFKVIFGYDTFSKPCYWR